MIILLKKTKIILIMLIIFLKHFEVYLVRPQLLEQENKYYYQYSILQIFQHLLNHLYLNCGCKLENLDNDKHCVLKMYVNTNRFPFKKKYFFSKVILFLIELCFKFIALYTTNITFIFNFFQQFVFLISQLSKRINNNSYINFNLLL